MTQAKSAPGRRDMGRRRSPEPLNFFIWTVEVLFHPLSLWLMKMLFFLKKNCAFCLVH
jgi:hypothetical protein